MTTECNAEIIAVGTELLLGQIANTNAQWISQQLADNGINVLHHEVVGDNLKRVANVFSIAEKRSNIIIITGGLGPTDDDLTREAFQTISQLPLVEHQPSLNKIMAFFKKQNSDMTANNRKQARVFQDAQVINNPTGMAPGMIVQYKGKTWIFLPGVPNEMKRMFKDTVIPFLINLTGQDTIIKSMILRFIGIGEAKLEHELHDLIKQQSNPTIAPLAQSDGVVIRLTVKENTIDRANEKLNKTKEQILSKVGTYYLGTDDETLEKKAIFMLKHRNEMIAVAESLTGGMFTQKLISVPGSSQVCRGGIVCYDPKIKMDVLNVSPQTIQMKGTVSYECALELATNVCQRMDATIGISFTGIAGPSSIEGKPVGTVFIGVCSKDGRNKVTEHYFTGDREAIRRKTVIKGFEMLFKFMKNE